MYVCFVFRYDAQLKAPINWSVVAAWVQCDESVGVVAHPTPGARAARATLDAFCSVPRLRQYEQRNDPTLVEGQSGLSPYLHYGQIAAQRAALSALAMRSESREGGNLLVRLIVVASCEHACCCHDELLRVCVFLFFFPLKRIRSSKNLL